MSVTRISQQLRFTRVGCGFLDTLTHSHYGHNHTGNCQPNIGTPVLKVVKMVTDEKEIKRIRAENCFR